MGIYDRDWYREHQAKLAKGEDTLWPITSRIDSDQRLPAFAPKKPSKVILLTGLLCVAVFSAVGIIVRVIRYLTG